METQSTQKPISITVIENTLPPPISINVIEPPPTKDPISINKIDKMLGVLQKLIYICLYIISNITLHQ